MKQHLLLSTYFSSLNEYRKAKGNSLEKARRISPLHIVEELEESGLRGRGGAGFPAGRKWRTLLESSSEQKYVVINSAEGEPGTFKDRMVLRKIPYAVIEGALIGAHVLSAKEVYIAIKKSFKKETRRILEALNDFEAAGDLDGIKVHVVTGPEDYLFGEEKALLNVIEGIGPFPREAHLPPYEVGLFPTAVDPHPALVSNVETFARVPSIILYGAESFNIIGTADTKGPIICTVIGDVKQPGVYEVGPGMTVDTLLNDLAGGPSRGMDFKAVLSGVSNPVLTKDNLHAQLEFEDMKEKGSGLGSAGFMVYDEGRSMPRLTQEVAKFLYKESCNQCTPCKAGLGNCSIHIDAMFVDNKDRTLIIDAIMAAKGAPNSNRCFLPVEGSLIIPSLIGEFKEEFFRSHEPQHLLTREVLPLITDYDEETHTFLIKDEPLLEDRPYSQDWDSFEPKIIDRGNF